MNTSRASVGLWVLGVLVAGGVVSGLLVLNAITLNADARAMRGAMLEGLNVRSGTRVQLSVGPLALAAVRFALDFVDRVPEEARLALSSARAASVGVYSLRNPSSEFDSGHVIVAVDAAMAERGWTRVVAATSHKEAVLIYTPTQGPDADSGPLRLCVGVRNGRELVVVSASVAPVPLVEFAAKHREIANL